MSVVNRTKGTNMSDTTTNESKSKVVDIFDKNLNLPTGEKKKMDSSKADEAWGFGAPPPKDYYDLKPLPSKDAWKYNEEYEYYSANLECRIVSENPDFDNIPVFATVTTRIGRGKGISTMAALFVKLGFKLPDEINDLELTKMLALALKKEKILRHNLIDWRLGYKVQPSGDWKNLYSTMTQFPQNPDGTFQHKVMVTVGQNQKEECNAQLTIVEFGDVNIEKVKAKSQQSNSQAKTGGGITLSKAASQGSQTELVLESDTPISSTPTDSGTTSPETVDVEISEDDLKLAEA